MEKGGDAPLKLSEYLESVKAKRTAKSDTSVTVVD